MINFVNFAELIIRTDMRKKMLSFGAMLCVLATPVAQIEAAPREAQSHYDKGIALSLIHISEPTRRS